MSQHLLTFAHAAGLLTLCFFASTASAMPPSMTPETELDALPDSVLEQYGRHRVKRGETAFGLARKAGMSVNVFHVLNMYKFAGGPDRLRAGGIVIMRNPLETAKVEAKEKHGGRFSVHDGEFIGKGPCRCGLDADLHSFVLCSWSIAWPEAGCGLSPKALEALRGLIIDNCFEGLRPTRKIEDAEKQTRQRARKKAFSLDWSEFCSVWRFYAHGQLQWPFGLTGDRTKWYGRPVLCFRNDGYSNDGGNGCHSYTRGFVLSIPDGKILHERDYFRADALDTVAGLVARQLEKKYSPDEVLTKKARVAADDSSCWITLSDQGMTWWIAPYAIFCGATGVAHVTIPWSELEPFAK